MLFLPEHEIEEALDLKGADRRTILDAIIDRLPGEQIPPASVDDFDDLCWQIYPRVTARYEQDPDFVRHRRDVLHMVEGGSAALNSETQ